MTVMCLSNRNMLSQSMLFKTPLINITEDTVSSYHTLSELAWLGLVWLVPDQGCDNLQL